MAEGEYDQAIASFRRADVGHNLREALPDLAEAYQAAGMRDSAIAVWERFVTIPYYAPGWVSPLDHVVAYEHLGRLYDAQGDLEKAALYYAKFVELWVDADPQLQPRVRAAQTRLEEILAERG